MTFQNTVAGILVILLVIFAVQSNETVAAWLLFWKITGSRTLILVLTFLVGAVAGELVSMQIQKSIRKT